MQTIEAEELLRLTRICLAEIGLEQIELQVIGRRPGGEPIIGTAEPIGFAIGYQVGLLLAMHFREPIACYACYLKSHGAHDQSISQACKDGQCSSPEGPARPPREELVGRP